MESHDLIRTPPMALVILLALIAFILWHALQRTPGYDNALLVIRVREGGLKVEHGRLPPDDLHRIEEILKDAEVDRADIALLRGGRVSFHRVPAHVHQILRNILLSA